MLNIELARRLKGWSQGDLGSHPKVRIDRGFIGLIERGQALPIPEQAERIAKALDVPVERLLEPVPAIPKELSVTDDADKSHVNG